jgi:hypothetical protein
MSDNEIRGHWADEYPNPLPDDLLRGVADNPGTWSKPMALELIAARARIAELEAESTQQVRYDVWLKCNYGINDSVYNEFLEWCNA